MCTSEFQTLKAILEKDRSIRRFDQNKSVSQETLLKLVELTRYCHSGRNIQPLKYRMVISGEECRKVFPTLAWAGYYTEWDGPKEGEKPVAYLIQCLDTALTTNPLCDEGLQLEALSLGCAAMGLGACIIKAFNVKDLSEALALPSGLEPTYVLAIGYPAENAFITDLPENGNYKYFRDDNDNQCVPKRLLSELII